MRNFELMDMEMSKLKKIAKDFESVLESTHEEKIHQFLVEQSFLFGFLRDHNGIVKSKFKLGNDFITDFLSIGTDHSNSPNLMITFIEIERPNISLFTKAGNPSADLSHALRQIQNWKTWIKVNRDYFSRSVQKSLNNDKNVKRVKRIFWNERGIDKNPISYFIERYLIIAGRRASLSVEDRFLLSQMNEDLHNINIVTFDVILEQIFQVLEWRQDRHFYQ
jgi:hypothetical protein